eukprot:TRINITY_DN1335_c0_g1_i1.p1 TRINITY_DN1335_c0_g1~~TRINITY_DN1335_c0_g1_i1.p1  ORF type:complete len:189 (-),score=52.04 TRINITY_DN1335_c0_g1_i1:107-673(-)
MAGTRHSSVRNLAETGISSRALRPVQATNRQSMGIRSSQVIEPHSKTADLSTITSRTPKDRLRDDIFSILERPRPYMTTHHGTHTPPKAVARLNFSKMTTPIQQKKEENQTPASHKSYRAALRSKKIPELIPLAKIYELEDVLVDASDQEIANLPSNYLDELGKLAAVINHRLRNLSVAQRSASLKPI